jgi:hypothetical protein
MALDEQQIETFYEQGYIVLQNCFSRDAGQQFLDEIYGVLDCKPDDPSTWKRPIDIGDPYPTHLVRDFAPIAWEAICDLVGGEERLYTSDVSMGRFVINFNYGSNSPWTPPSAHAKGWHVDGDFFRHFLDSGGLGVLATPILSDIEHRGGGTFVAADSVPIVSRYLLEHPEGLEPIFDFQSLVDQCRDFRELIGTIGDVVLFHPFTLHSRSQNHRGVPRGITSMCVPLKEPMDFNREDPSQFSVIERAILLGLGVKRLDFKITGTRKWTPPAM